MARDIAKVNADRVVGAASWRSIASFLLTWLTCSFANAQGSDGSPEFLIVNRTDRLTIYDARQQRLSPNSSEYPPAFSPFLVVLPRVTLSDNFTVCTKVRFLDTYLFILKNDRGSLSTSGKVAFMRTVRALRLLDDTIEVLSSQLILNEAGSNTRSHLARGTKVRRVFETESSFYVFQLGKVRRFGWMVLPARDEHRAWQVVREPTRRRSLDLETVAQIARKKADELNALFARLIHELGRDTVHPQPAPFWSVKTDPHFVVCELRPPSYADKMTESTRELARQLSASLLGTDFIVREGPGRLEITRR